MKDDTTSSRLVSISSQDVLTEILKEGARTMLASAIESEVAEYITQHADKRDSNGYRLVVRNGYLPERSIQTGIGSIPVQQPRVHDKRDGERFTSEILPPYLRKTKSLEELIPWLYLKAHAEQSFDLFVTTFSDKYPKAVECLQKDRDVLLTFYDFPAKHWVHIRTSNPIESTFASVRLRTAKTRGSGSRTACLTRVFKLVQSAEKRWRSLKGSELLPEVISGIRFINGIKEMAA